MSRGERQRVLDALVADRIYQCDYCGRKWGVKFLTVKPAGFYNRAAVGGMCPECFTGRTNGASGRVADAMEFLMEGEEGE